jgi:hypothetical protein
MLAQALLPGESRDVAVVVRPPKNKGSNDLLIGGFQENCLASDDASSFTKIDTFLID